MSGLSSRAKVGRSVGMGCMHFCLKLRVAKPGSQLCIHIKGGWARFKRDASTSVFAPLIETIRHPEANAWKFAVNYLQPGRKASGSKDVHLFGYAFLPIKYNK